MQFNDTYTVKFRRIYSSLPEKSKKIKKIYGLFLVVSLSIYISLSILSKIHWKETVFFSLKVIAVFIITYLIIKWLYKLFDSIYGNEIRLEYQRELTREYVTNIAPKKIKFWGYTGAGKDTTVAGFSTFAIEHLKNKVSEDMFEIKKILYIFDFDKIDEFIDLNHDLINHNSVLKNREYFINSLKENNSFVKKTYIYNLEEFKKEENKCKNEKQKKILIKKYEQKVNPIKFIDDYLNMKDNLRNKDNYWIISDGINYTHFIDELIKYINLYVRINYLDNFILSNQPFYEEENKTAKVYSFDMMRTKNEDLYLNGLKYKRKVKFPWIEYLCIIETEVDAWLSNIDEEARKTIKQSGLRNFKAFQRHLLGENIFHYQIGQTAARTEKSVRELDHAFCRVFQLDKLYGGIRRINRVQHKISKLESKKKKNEIIYEKISKLTIRYKTLLMQGYLRISLVINRSDNAVSAEDIKLEDLLSMERPKENYMTVLTFKMSDCWGKNNTHYLKFIAEKLNNESDIQFVDIPTWSGDLTMHKEQALFMDYEVLNKMYGFSQEEILKAHYIDPRKE